VVGVEKLEIRQHAEGAAIAVKVVSSSSRGRIVGVLGDCLKIAVSAPAERGRANAAAAGILAEALGVPRRNVTIASGQTNPRKQFLIRGMSADAIRQALALMQT
jgi:hypothetical protein